MTRICKRIFRDTFILFVLSGIAASLVYAFHPKVLSFSEAKPDLWAIHLQMISEMSEPLWIDARSLAEYELEHIPGAISLNLDENWDSGFQDLLVRWTAGRLVVVYCSSDSCHSSREIVHILREELADDHIFFLKGGWEKWKGDQK